MLVQFMVKNFLSFKDETVLDMSAVTAYKEHGSNVITHWNKEKFLRVAAIYGANASGKTNLNAAMSSFQHIISESLNNADEDGKTALERYYSPFAFDNGSENTEFQVIEIIDEAEYIYGFEYNRSCIEAEWLYKKNLKTNRTVTIFERTAETADFGASVRKECDVYKEQIPSETLVLSFFNKLKLKNEIFRDMYNAIMDTLVVPSGFCDNPEILVRYLPVIIDNEKEQLNRFLKAIDIGIADISYEINEKEIRFFTMHKGKDGVIYPLDLSFESEGTIKSIILFIYAREAVRNNLSMFVDELNIKLHPLLLKFIVNLFYDESSQSQLIYTTHDTTLMDKRFFRRDQLWFVQKDEFGYSTLCSLSDFKIRSDASFEKDYLAGVYGGIPMLQDYSLKEGE